MMELATVQLQGSCSSFSSVPSAPSRGSQLKSLLPSVSVRAVGRKDRLVSLKCRSCSSSYNGTRAYAQSKLGNILHAKELSRQLKLVTEVKEKLAKDHNSLPVGKYGRDDEEMILWFLKDRKFSVEETASKLTKAISWRKDFRVSELSEESVKHVAKTGKAYLHNYPDVHSRPVLIVDVSKHFPGEYELYEDERLCVFLIETALSKLPEEKQEVLVILDLRGFQAQNSDLKFLTFVFDAFYYYYPRRLGQVLFVDAPFIFKPFWQLVKPLLKSYTSLVRFCSAKEVREEYFTADTVPTSFR